MDVEDIKPGENFAQAIEQTLARCSIVLVVIGPRWRSILNERAQRSDEDYVLREVAAALQRKTTVVPILVGSAQANSLNGLPHELADLSFREAVELRDSSFKDDCDRLVRGLQLRGGGAGILRRWIPPIAAALVIGGFLMLFAARQGLGPWRADHERKQQISQLGATAKSQMEQAEYESAFKSYEQVLSLSSANQAALNGQLDAAMKWLEHFHVLAGEGQKAEDIAAPLLAQLKTVLEAGLARNNQKDARSADILAHLGWAHWLNEKMAFKEFDNAERYFNQALTIDPKNVYANAFLGNWLLHSNGDSRRALAAFQTSLAGGRERELVRSMQLGGLYHNDDEGLRGELVKALNEMRLHNETLDGNLKGRLSYLYDPTVSNADELREVLTAVASREAWATFLWTNSGDNSNYFKVRRDFIHASLAELSGDSPAALAEFKSLAAELARGGFNGRIRDYTAAALKRLAR